VKRALEIVFFPWTKSGRFSVSGSVTEMSESATIEKARELIKELSGEGQEHDLAQQRKDVVLSFLKYRVIKNFCEARPLGSDRRLDGRASPHDRRRRRFLRTFTRPTGTLTSVDCVTVYNHQPNN
jgi:hypothetical protein